MAAFCHFYGLTPAEFRALTVADFTALREYREWVLDEQRKALKGIGR